MSSKFSIALALAVTLVSCSGEESLDVPDGLLPPEKMIPLVVDLQVLEAHFHRQYQRPDVYKASLDSSSKFIFIKYETNREDFDRSYEYYARNSQALYEIYEAALDTLNFRMSEPIPVNAE